MRAKDSDFSAINDIDKEIAEVEEKLEKVRKITLNISDTTPEALAMEMYRQGGKMGIIDDEGAIFDVLSGIYSSRQVNINIFLKAYDGGNYSIARRTAENIELKNPILTMGIMVQPEHLTEAMSNRQFLDRGLMHRFLFAFPESKAGYLKMSSPDIPPELKNLYHKLINNLLEMPANNYIIVCDKEAEIVFSDYFYYLQKEMRDGGCFENLQKWANKQFGRALRIAGILHLCEHLATEKLTYTTALNAVEIAKWSEKHALNAFSGNATEPEEIKNAKCILKKLKKSGKERFSKHNLLLLCRPLHAPEINSALEILEDMGYIRIEFIKNSERGKPKEIIKINPVIF